MPKFNFNISEEITRDKILEKTTEQDIYEYYLGSQIKEGYRYSTPWREDKNPSLTFIKTYGGKLLWRDWGDVSQSETQDVFDFVCKLKSCKFVEALNIIKRDLALGIKSSVKLIEKTNLNTPQKLSPPIKKTIEIKKKKVIEIEPQIFTKTDLNYWSKYYISLEALLYYNVKPVRYCWVDNVLSRIYSKSSPIYSYGFNPYDFDQDTKYKIYAPFADARGKWLSNVTSDILQGEDQLLYTDTKLIITKSLKDVMVLSELGYESIAPQSESIMIAHSDMLTLSMWYTDIYIFYDNDMSGILAARKFSKKYNLRMMYIPKKYGVKDISDFIEAYGIEQSKILITELINTAEIWKKEDI